MSFISNTPSAQRRQISDADLCAWIGQASPGDILEYHRGSLALDCVPHSLRLPEHERAELSRVASWARWADKKALVRLVQRRHGLDDYSYLAIAQLKPRQAPTPIASLLIKETFHLTIRDS